MAARKPSATSALLTVLEAAAELRCSDDLVYSLISDGTLTAVNIARDGSVRPKIRVSRTEINDLIRRRSSNSGRLRSA